MYAEAFRQGKKVAQRILSYLRPDLAARYAGQAAQPSLILPPQV